MYLCLAFLTAGFLALLAAMFIIEWRRIEPTIRGRARVLRVSHRLLFLFGLCVGSLKDRAHGRGIAYNAILTPFETGHNGTESLDADTTVSFFNALVKVGSDDHHFTPTTAVTDVGLGIVINDLVDTGEPGAVRKVVALLGVYPGTLPGVAAGAISAGAFVVPDNTTPGRVKQPAANSGAAMVIGRARFATTTAGDPVSIIHCVPFSVTF